MRAMVKAPIWMTGKNWPTSAECDVAYNQEQKATNASSAGMEKFQ